MDGADDFVGELHLIHAVVYLGQIEPHSAQTATGEPLDGDRPTSAHIPSPAPVRQ
jgi:hypothetical protein